MVLLASPLAFAACAAERDTVAAVELLFPSDPGCRPAEGAVDWLAVRALGDFAASAEAVAILPLGAPSAAFDGFPPPTRLFAFETTGSHRAGAAVPVSSNPSRGLLLPYGRSCALPAGAITLPEGAAWAVTAEGELIVAGGEEEGEISRRLVRLGPGEERGRRIDMRLRRYGATATATSLGVVIAGGSQDRSGGIHDTFERFSPHGGEVELAAYSLASPRRDHAALRLPDDRVLLVGGRSEPMGEALTSAERIDLVAGRTELVGGSIHARIRPTLLLLDDGTVVLAGGLDGEGKHLSAIEIFDPRAAVFTEPEGEGRLPDWAEGIALTLPGGRFAYLGVDGSELALALYAHRPGSRGGASRLLRHDLRFGRPPPLAANLVAETLDDGTIVVAGDDVSGVRRSFVVDPGTAIVRETGAVPAAQILVSRSDGSLVALSRDTASVRREILRTPYDNPPATVGAGFTEGLALSAPRDWQPVPGGFLAIAADARFDLPSLRFADFSLVLDVGATSDGATDAELLLVRDEEAPLSVRITDEEVVVGTCTITRAENAPIAITRRGETLTVDAGRGGASCRLGALTRRVGLAVRAQPGTIVRALRDLTRR